jgi:hypothetical protein
VCVVVVVAIKQVLLLLLLLLLLWLLRVFLVCIISCRLAAMFCYVYSIAVPPTRVAAANNEALQPSLAVVGSWRWAAAFSVFICTYIH